MMGSVSSRIMKLIFLLLHLFSVVHSFRFLVYSAQYGKLYENLARKKNYSKSHVNFLASLTDVLVDAGHEVVILSPVLDSTIGGPMTKKARIIEIPQSRAFADYEKSMLESSQNVWEQNLFRTLFGQGKLLDACARACESVVTHLGLIDQLKSEKFDAAFGESLDVCGPVVFHLAGIEKWAVTDSVAIRDGGFYVTQTPSMPAYVPSLLANSNDKMSFFSRLANALRLPLIDFFMERYHTLIEGYVRQHEPTLPKIRDILSTNSLVFLNSEPLVDFPKITSARIIDIGGISVSSKPKPLNSTWSSILDLRPNTIFLSFGSVAKSHAMPEEYKKTIRETFIKFPDVTFIWKYEKPEDEISAEIPNLIESTWLPQRDLLHDTRLSAFITHCGQGSTTEAIGAGTPLIVIPVVADQMRNAHLVERNGIGLRLEKTDLSGGNKLENAIREILENDSYRTNAMKLRQTIADRPIPMKQIFVKNMEFLAKHGPLRQLDHYGRHLNFFQYYLIDVIGFVVLIAFSIFAVAILAIRNVLRRLIKSKQDYSTIPVEQSK